LRVIRSVREVLVGFALEVPADRRIAGLAVERRASRGDLAAVWLERGTRTINLK
jgi:hypothetical protein